MHKSDIRHKNTSLQQKLEKLFTLRTGSKVNWDQSSYIKLLNNMGNPQDNLPPVIHVAGTNGKGSIIAILRSILEAQGYKVHAYTSPHLVRMNERIVLAGKTITDNDLEERIDDLMENHDLTNLSFFEITTALAFKAFSQIAADILLLEVGMGGRLDCTNIIKRPALSIISRISKDHTGFLGQTLTKIAAEKAGIIKESTPCVINYQGRGRDATDILQVFENTAKKLKSDLYIFNREWFVSKDNNKEKIIFKTGDKSQEYFLPSLCGEHQIYNAGTALMALHLLRSKFQVSKSAIDSGLKKINWPGRMQYIDGSAFNMPKGTEIWLDAGHNDSAGEVIANQIKLWRKKDNEPLYLIVGMLNTKDIYGFLSPLLDKIDELHIVNIRDEPNTMSSARFLQQLQQRGNILEDKNIYEHEDVFEALSKISNDKSLQPCRILIAGSVYLVGDVLNNINM